MTNKGVFRSALILVARESLATVDKQALRACGVRDFQILSSGVEAALVLASGKGPEVTLCADTLADMSGDDFVRLVRLHPALVPYPVIVAVTTVEKDLVDKARSAGYSGLLQRPYTHDALAKQMERALQCRNATAAALAGRDQLDIAPFMTALNTYQAAFNPEEEATEQMLRHGLLSVKQQRWAEGIADLENVLRRDGSQVEALLGLSAAWRARGNEARSLGFLRDAVAALADKRQWDKAQIIAARLLRESPDIPNPLFEEVARLITNGAVKELDNAIDAGLALNHSIYPVDMLLRACAACASPDEAKELLLDRCVRCGAARLTEDLRLQGGAMPIADVPAAFGSPEPAVDTSAAAKAFGTKATKSIDGKDAVARPSEGKKSFFGRKKKKKAQKSTELSEPGDSVFATAFPSLHEALMVAKVTLSLFRHMK